MALRDWLRPPRHLVALFLLLTLAPSLVLIAFGWRLLRQDLELERQQATAVHEQAADVVVAALEQTVSAAEAAMADLAGLEAMATPEGAVAVVFAPDGVRGFPQGRLIFHPVAAPGVEAPATLFSDGELIEFRDRDPVRAAVWFRELAGSPAESVRAGALIRLARNLRKAGDTASALDAYARVSAPASAVGGVPADLLARWARCGLLASAGTSRELQEDARRLSADLSSGRWQLDRAQFHSHLADATRWAGSGAGAPAPEGLALAAAVEQLYRRWQRATSGPFSGRSAETIDGMLMTLLWRGTREQAVALVAGADYARSQWLGRLAPLQERHAVRASISDPALRATPGLAGRRSAAETGLPWTVFVEPAGPTASGIFAGRRTVWLAALGIIALLVVSGTYVVGRAVSRELAVARLQSDFVSAVSHEFRTPLTSLRQLSEMLIERPAIPDDRRQSYYAALARQTERLHRLVESLLDFGRMEAGTSPYRLVPLDAGALVADVVEQFAGEAAARGYEIRLTSPGTAGTIAADRDALTNALWNLLDNAVKYSPESRLVWVDVRSEAAAVSIAVRDRGLGIPADEQREIFGKFVRGATARAGNIRGTGLGLAMVLHIVNGHGGSVSVESAPGQGSTFTLSVPRMVAAITDVPEAACLES